MENFSSKIWPLLAESLKNQNEKIRINGMKVMQTLLPTLMDA